LTDRIRRIRTDTINTTKEKVEVFELFLNAARLAASDDVRESVSSILELIRRMPEWEKDICTLQANIAQSYSEQASLLSGLTSSKMKKLSYPNEAIEAFDVVFSELVTNAFEHGCTTKKDRIKLIIDITGEYIALTVINPKRRSVNLDFILAKNRSLLADNPYLQRGRGLMIVADLADTLEETVSGDGIKAVIYPRRVSFEVDVIEDLTIIQLTGGVRNPSLMRRLVALASNYLENDLILDFSRYASKWRWKERFFEMEDSLAPRMVLHIEGVFSKVGKKVVLLVGYHNPIRSNVDRTFPDALIAYSLNEALQKIGRSNLSKKIRARVKRLGILKKRLYE
jgi:anti-sigma regulatory factor (Ser/Thr protein kinase)